MASVFSPGNLVGYKGNEVVVQSSDFGGITYSNGSCDVYISNPFIESIPLHDKNLLDLGFKVIYQSDGGYFSKKINEKDYIAVNPKGVFIVVDNHENLETSGIAELSIPINISFVHEMQNLCDSLIKGVK